MDGVRIAWAMHQGRLVSVDEVPPGLAADCTCPECHGVVIARKGNERSHHFAHRDGAAQCSLANPGGGAADAVYEAHQRLAVRVVRKALEDLEQIDLPGLGVASIIERHLAEPLATGLVVDRLVTQPRDAAPLTFALEITATGRLGSERLEGLRDQRLDTLVIEVRPDLVVGFPPAWLGELIEHGAARYWRSFSTGAAAAPDAGWSAGKAHLADGRPPAIPLDAARLYSANYPMRALKEGRPLPYDISALRASGLPLFCPVKPREKVDGGVLDIPPHWRTERVIRANLPDAVLGPPVAYLLRFDGPVALHDADAAHKSAARKMKREML